MNSIDEKFRELKANEEKAFIVYITAGFPDIKTTKDLVLEFDKCGADIIELGIPFSDPIADGPVIQNASHHALLKGADIDSILKALRPLKDRLCAALVFMTYFNPIFKYGLERFVKDSKQSGIDGVIVPDLPLEESGELIEIGKKYGFSVILLVSPTSTDDRMRLIAKKSGGFIYYVALTGVTGARKNISSDAGKNIKKIKSFTDKPVCSGFGVSDPAQAKEIAKLGDGVIVGSAVIRVIQDNIGRKDLVKKTGHFVSSLIKGVKP